MRGGPGLTASGAQRRPAVLASGNRHKLEELRLALPVFGLEALTGVRYPPETGTTYAENALGKARFGRAHAPPGSWVLGEDSGIEVAALGGGPGIASARWADDGVRALLDALGDEPQRAARYVCVLCAVAPDGEETCVEGVLEGTVATAPRGSEGFGYDPVFVPHGQTRTVAELGDAWKRLHSHRARAAAALVRALA